MNRIGSLLSHSFIRPTFAVEWLTLGQILKNRGIATVAMSKIKSVPAAVSRQVEYTLFFLYTFSATELAQSKQILAPSRVFANFGV